MWHVGWDTKGATGFRWETEKKSLIGRPRYRLEDNFKMDVQEMGWGTWTDVARERVRRRAVVNALIIHWGP